MACFYFLPYSFWYFLNFFVVRNVFWIIWPFLVLLSTPGQLVYVIPSASWDHQSHYHQAQILRMAHSAGVSSAGEIAVKLDIGARRVLGMSEEGNESLDFSFFCMDNRHTCTWTGRHGQTNARIRQEQIGDNGDLVLWYMHQHPKVGPNPRTFPVPGPYCQAYISPAGPTSLKLPNNCFLPSTFSSH